MDKSTNSLKAKMIFGIIKKQDMNKENLEILLAAIISSCNDLGLIQIFEIQPLMAAYEEMAAEAKKSGGEVN